MDKKSRISHIRMLLSDPAFEEALSYIEQREIDYCLNCDAKDDHGRLAHARQARAIRELRSKFKSILTEDEFLERKSARQGQ